MVVYASPPVRVRKKFAPVNTVPFTVDPSKFANDMLAFVKLIPDNADVDPWETACELVPNTNVDTFVPLMSTFGPIINPRYKTYPDPTVNVGKLPAVGVTIDPDVLIFVRLAFVKFTLATSSTLRKSKFVKFASLKFTPGPIMNPPDGLVATRRLYTYGLERMGPDASESISIHPDFILVNVAFVRLANDKLIAFDCVLKSYDVKFAPLKSTRGPYKYPPKTLNLGGRMGCDVGSTEIPPDFTFVSVAPVKLTPVSTVFERSNPVKFVNDMSTFAPIMYPFRITYPAF